MSFTMLAPAANRQFQVSSGRTYTSDANSVISSVSSGDSVDLLKMGCVFADVNTGKNNIAATTDPTTGDDTGDGYAVGSLWVNLTDDRVWLCTDATLTTAVWKQVGGSLATSLILGAAAAGIVFKQGANGRYGTFTANGATGVDVANTSVTALSQIVITLKTPGGTVGAIPAVKTITPTTGFNVAGTAMDTSVYNYMIFENAA